jgi:hypothetical protein
MTHWKAIVRSSIGVIKVIAVLININFTLLSNYIQKLENGFIIAFYLREGDRLVFTMGGMITNVNDRK